MIFSFLTNPSGDAPRVPSRLERRVHRCVAAFFIAMSLVFLLAWCANYESNVIIFMGNVFAPALLALLLIATAVAEVSALIRARRRTPQDFAVRYTMIVAVLVPTVMGEIRSGAFDSRQAVASEGVHISVLDANLLGPIDVAEEFYDAIERLDPDIITLQELNPVVARNLIDRFGDGYSCQQLQPQVGVYGMGVLAKYPCVNNERSKALEGIGVPQIVDVQITDSQQVAIVNMHTIPPHTLLQYHPSDNEFQRLANAVVERERFVTNLIEVAHSHKTAATILAGDLNATTRNRVYKLIRASGFSDAWSVGNRFNGGTWPNKRLPLLQWLVRIDYIFHTDALTPKTAQTLVEGFGSDHRGVFATFALANKPS